MPRPATGQVIEREGARGTSYALRFRAYGRRRYLTLGTNEEGWSRDRAELELSHVLADVQRGLWREPNPAPVAEPREEPTFHVFASEWLTARAQERLAERTIEDYRWALTHHLLPFFADYRLSAITVREVDRYKAAKAAEGVLGANQVNKTLTRLSQILAVAVEYELIAANPAAGKRRRLKSTRPRRSWVEPEQLMALLGSAPGYRRPLLAVLAGAGLRVGEALALRWADVDLATGTLRVLRSKTDAGVRLVDLTPALREELAAHKADASWAGSNDFVFATASGRPRNRHNERRAALLPAIEKANARLRGLGIAPIEGATFHGLRRTYASLRAAVGDDPAYTSEQIGHDDPRFTLRVYTYATKRRQRLAGTHRAAFDRALEWAQMGTSADYTVPVVLPQVNAETRNAA